MAKIKIYGDVQKGCIFFDGSTVEPKFLGTILAEIKADETDRIVIYRTDRVDRSGNDRQLFRRLNPNRVQNEAGEDLVSALGYTVAQVVEYINEQANLTASVNPDVNTDLSNISVDFTRDATDTSIIFSNGYQFGVNTIKAMDTGDGLITIKSIEGSRELFTKLDISNVQVNGVAVSGGLNDVINTLNEFFTVGAFESVVISDPYSTMIADVSGIDAGYTLEGADAIDPIGDDIFTYDGVGYNNYAGLKSTATINQKGEYYTFDIRGEGAIGFGLIHTQDSFDSGLFSGNSNYANPSSFATIHSAHYGFQFSHWFHPTPNGSWTNYGANTSYSMRSGWSNFNGTDEQADWLAGNPIKIKVGIDENGYIAISTLRNGTDWVVHSRSGYPLPEGSSYHLGIKSQSTAARVYSAPKVHLLEETAPTMYFRYIESPDGNFEYPLFATAEEANYYDEQNGGSGASHIHVYVDDPTNTSWYMPETNAVMNGTSAPAADLTLGQAATYTEITSLSDSELAPASFFYVQQYMIEGGTINYQLSPQDAPYTTTIANEPVWMSLSGSNLTGSANYVSADTDYTIDVTRTNSYGSTTATITVTVQDNIVASQLSGITTAYGNTLNPNNVFSTERFAGRLDTLISQGQEISWTHRDYTVGGFLTAGGESNFNAGADISDAGNWDVRFSTWSAVLMQTFSRGWAVGGSQNVGNLDGATHKMVYKTDGYVEYYLNDVLKYTSASALSGDKYLYLMTPNTYNLNIELPVDFSVTTTGAGSTTAPSGFVSPLTQGETGGTDILGNGSDAVATSIMTVQDGYRLIITESWIETNVLPYMDSDEDKVFLGIPKTTANWSSVTLDDFDMVIRLQKSGNGVKSLLWDNGANDNELTVSSLTDALYNYAFEWDGTDLSVIANTSYGDYLVEPSVANGGNFNRVVTHSGFTQQSGDLPFVLATNDDGQVKLNPYFLGMSIPAAPTTNLTPWTKALDFSGSNEHAKQVTSSNAYNAIRMTGIAQTVPNNFDSGRTSAGTYARPFSTAIVFKIDGNNSNQHIWNSGEGTGSNDDNIAIRLSASKNLYLHWGRSGSENECQITSGGVLATNQWYGLYVTHKGGRFNSSDATASNLADAFDIRLMSSSDGFGSVGSNLSTSGTWLNTGDRMDRTIGGDFTVGGRGSNRNFHGKVASMVITTLKKDKPIPTDAEIKLMITDPNKWEDDYRVGQTVRASNSDGESSYNPNQGVYGYYGTQIWLMGDGTYDSYANGIRNQVYFSDQNFVKLQLNSMVSNDIQTVNINGLT